MLNARSILPEWDTGRFWIRPIVDLDKCRGFSGRTTGVHLDHEIDLEYTSPTDLVYQESIQIRKFRQRVEDSLVAVLLSDGVLLQELIKSKGFTVCEVRVRPDKRVAYIQWNCLPGLRVETQNEINKHMKRIRIALGDKLRSRFTPYLQFRHDSLTAEQTEVEQVFGELEEQETLDRLERMVPRQLDIDTKAFEKELLSKAGRKIH